MVPDTGMAPDTVIAPEKDNFKTEIRTRLIRFMSTTHDHYTTYRKLATGMRLF